ncbi:unnamed protein product [Citrullus colocynthis]|uniref:Uncharacterized protein n=1 Tax=Citrullus colocynthis TaxID=252529 RepID=A0ABP0ZEB0_9ROSI
MGFCEWKSVSSVADMVQLLSRAKMFIHTTLSSCCIQYPAVKEMAEKEEKRQSAQQKSDDLGFLFQQKSQQSSLTFDGNLTTSKHVGHKFYQSICPF